MSVGPRWAAGGTCVVAALALAVVDHRTGPYFSFSLFYFVPIVAASWWLGAVPGVVVAAVSGVGWLACEIAWPETPGGVHLAWNTFTRFTLFLGLSGFVSLLRRDRRALALSNEALRATAAREAVLARTDALTGLLNVRAFRERLQEELARARSLDSGLCLAVVDLNGFKTINDRLGHGAGDALLQQVASTMRDCVREEDLTARIGGDEFAICFHDAHPNAAADLARRLAERLQEVAAEASIGLACFDLPPASLDALLSAADRAMYAAKSQGGREVVVWRDMDLASSSQA